MIKYWFFGVILLVGVLACHNHDDSPEIKQAKAVHEGMILLHAQLDSIIDLKTVACNQLMASAESQNDSLRLDQLQGMYTGLVSLHDQLAQWKEGLVEVPGHDHTHADGEHHHHDRESEAVMKDLSDAEVLEIQQQLEANLKEIEAACNAVNLQ
jgi:hypothetical protein